MKKVLLALLIIIGGLMAIYYFGSGQVAAQFAGKWLQEQGIAYKNLNIVGANLRGAGVSSVTLGSGDNIIIEGADIRYNVHGSEAAWRSVEIRSVTLDTGRGKTGWDLGGLEQKFGLPAFEGERLDTLRITGAVKAEPAEGGFTAELSEGTLSYESGELRVTADVGKASIAPTDTPGTFDLALEMKNLIVTSKGEPMTVPLTASITGTLKGSKLTAQGRVADAQSAWPLIVNGNYDTDAGKGAVQWTSAQVTFAEGGLQPSVLSPMLGGMPDFDATLTLEGSARFTSGKPPVISSDLIFVRAALSPLLKMAFKDDISVTGELKGRVPVRWGGEAIAQIASAKLTNIAPGKLIYDPLTGVEALAGNPQSDLLLQALKGFEYESLTLDIASDAKGGLKAVFNIKGRNPEFFGGKPVDFTLNVNGNLLSLLETQRKLDNIIDNP